MTIDWWTLGIQTVNVVILVWLLGRYFWRPVAAMIEQRRVAAQRLLAEAETKQNAATTALAEIQHTRAGFAQEREAILGAAREAGERERAIGLEEAAKASAALQAAARAQIEREKEAVEKAWSNRAGDLAIEIARRLAARLDGSTVRGAFLDWLVAEFAGYRNRRARRWRRIASRSKPSARHRSNPPKRSDTGRGSGTPLASVRGSPSPPIRR